MKNLTNMRLVSRINAFLRHHAANLKNLRIGRARIWYLYYCAIRKLKGGGPRVFLLPTDVVSQKIGDWVIVHGLYDVPLAVLVEKFLANVRAHPPLGARANVERRVEV